MWEMHGQLQTYAMWNPCGDDHIYVVIEGPIPFDSVKEANLSNLLKEGSFPHARVEIYITRFHFSDLSHFMWNPIRNLVGSKTTILVVFFERYKCKWCLRWAYWWLALELYLMCSTIYHKISYIKRLEHS